MEVKPGYKQTEVGVIPVEWDVIRLGELADMVTSGSRGWARFYSERGALFVRSQNVRDVHLCLEDVQHVSPPVGAEGNRTKVRLGDLLITVTGNSVGNVAMVEQAFDEAYISQHVGLVRLKEPKNVSFVCRYLSPGSPGNPQIAGSQSGQSKPGLNLQNLKDFLIALPRSQNERQSVATALSDIDDLIQSLERLVAKKRDLKQAAMQQLLTGQTRLPGFSGEWEAKTLGDVVQCDSSGTYGLEKPVGDMVPMPVATTAQITADDKWNYKPMTKRFFYPRQLSEYCVEEGDLVVVKSSGSAASIQSGKMVLIDENLAGSFLFSNFLMRLRPKACDASFLYYYLTSSKVKAIIPSVCEASTYPNIRINEYLEIAVPVPHEDEQAAIAEVLSDMDTEITALEARLAKTRDLKQGMMQELLTGRTRLV